jgi:hypothetical protein
MYVLQFVLPLALVFLGVRIREKLVYFFGIVGYGLIVVNMLYPSKWLLGSGLLAFMLAALYLSLQYPGGIGRWFCFACALLYTVLSCMILADAGNLRFFGLTDDATGVVAGIIVGVILVVFYLRRRPPIS